MRAYLTPLALVCLASPAFAAKGDSTNVPMPPTLVGNASEAVLSKPIAPASGPAQTVVAGERVALSWWHAFGSVALDTLVDRALLANNEIAVAKANLAQAHELARAARGGALPQADLGYNVERQRLSRTLSSPLNDPAPTIFSLHTAQVSVSYAPDLFGGNAARVRSAKAAERVAAERLAGQRNMIVANTILAVIQNAMLEAQEKAARTALNSNRELLDLTRRREALGAVGKADVAAQELALASAETTLAGLERVRRTNLAVLSVLLGEDPGTSLPSLPALADLRLPDRLPLALPSDLLAQRPDVAAAAATLEGAGADVKVAIAARLPVLSLSATAGGTAQTFSDMFRVGNPFWTLLGGLTAPLFHGGALKHQQKAAEAALEAAKASYRATALQSFADVSNALTALATDGDALDAAKRADDAASRNLDYAQRRLRIGVGGTFDVYVANAAAQSARSQAISAIAMRLSDSVALFTALGGNVQAEPK